MATRGKFKNLESAADRGTKKKPWSVKKNRKEIMANQNPKDLSDEELDKVIAEELNPEPAEEEEVKEPENPTPPEEEEPAKEPPEEPAEEEETPPEEEPEPKPSRREVKRIHDLLKKYPDNTPPERPPAKPAPTDAFDIERDVDADPELKKRLIEDRNRAAEVARREGQQAGQEFANNLLFQTRLEIDAPKMETKYPVLDKDSEKFNANIAKDINEHYLIAVGYNPNTKTVRDPNLRYSDYVEASFALAAEIAGEQTVVTKKNIVKQAANTAIRPDGGSSKKLNLNKPAHRMSDEELDAALDLQLKSQ